MDYMFQTTIKLYPLDEFYVLEKPEILYAGDFDTIAATCVKNAKYDEVIVTFDVIANKESSVGLYNNEIVMWNEKINAQLLNKKTKNNDIAYYTTKEIKESAMDLLSQTISTIYGVSIKTSVILRGLKVEDGKVTDLRVNKYSRVYLYLRKPGYVRKCVPQLVLEGRHVRFLGDDDDSLPIDHRDTEILVNLDKLKEETGHVIRLVKAADIDSDYESEVTDALSDLEHVIMDCVESTVVRIVKENWRVVAGEQKK